MQKALKAAGIEVTSVIEVYKEEIPVEPEAEEPETADPTGNGKAQADPPKTES